MKKLVLGLALTSLAACSRAPSEEASLESVKLNSRISLSFTTVSAGVDFPTDSPMPRDLENKKVLLVSSSKIQGGSKRILVEKSAKISDPVAGVDYPTDMPAPSSLVGKKILILNASNRLVMNIQVAEAGVDFPTDAPAKDFLVLVVTSTKRFPIEQIHSIEKAIAGVDYPTETARDFYVLVTIGGQGQVRHSL